MECFIKIVDSIESLHPNYISDFVGDFLIPFIIGTFLALFAFYLTDKKEKN